MSSPVAEAHSANIARHLPLMAAVQPTHPALKVPHGRTSTGAIAYLTLSFAELDQEVDGWALRLRRAGIAPGDRVLLMVKQGLPLIAAVFALFKLGAVPVVIDPGMGLRSFLRCVAHTRPSALVGIPVARWLSRLAFIAFRSVQIRVAASADPCARVHPVAHEAVPALPRAATDLAAILFTSGSTGAPKGVCYEHGMFAAQVEMIRTHYGIQPGEVDLPLLPIFALFNPALGMTTVVPELDPSRPARFDPDKIIQALQQEGVTNSFGSPTLWGKIIARCRERGITLPQVRRVLCAGAPVPERLWTEAGVVLRNGQLHSPYGATEALPVSSLAANEYPAQALAGACVGRPLANNRVCVVAPCEGPLTEAGWHEMPTGQVGEIVVAGPSVTREYFARPEATVLAKVHREGVVWHRMGDLGFFDGEGRLWFCGRKVEGVTTASGCVYTEPVERVFRDHPDVVRCALVGVGPAGAQRLALVVQPRSALAAHERRALAQSLRARGRLHAVTASLTLFYFHPRFPVDVRHNAKIHRLTLARWVATQKAEEVP